MQTLPRPHDPLSGAVHANPPTAPASLCERCSRVNIETLLSTSSLELAARWTDICAKASVCALCATLANFHAHEQRRAPHADARVVIERSGAPGGRALWELLLCTHGEASGGEVRRESLAALHVFAEAEDPAAARCQGLVRRRVGGSTASDCSARTARRWLRDCVEWHSWLEGAGTPDAGEDFAELFPVLEGMGEVQPLRLVDCFPSGPMGGGERSRAGGGRRGGQGVGDGATPMDPERHSCRVVARASSPGPYAALSYCWGNAASLAWLDKTSPATENLTHLDEAALPRTLRDAIAATRSLDLRYLWVDALCIQQHSRADWLSESAKMGAIFGNAAVTLCAASSASSDAGLFNTRSVPALDHPANAHRRVTVASTLADGRRSVLDLYLEPFSMLVGGPLAQTAPHQPQQRLDNPAALLASTLRARAWCCQEALLSPRKLFYAADQLHWACRHVHRSEDRTHNEAPRSWHHRAAPSPDFAAAHFWYDVLVAWDYSTRRSTRRSDALIALSGLARRAAAALSSRYLAGVWQAHLAWGLSWSVTEVRQLRREVREGDAAAYSAPSWSWASAGREVNFHCSPPQRPIAALRAPGCSLVRASIELATEEDEFGAVTHGALTLAAAVVSVDACTELAGGSRTLLREVELGGAGVRGSAILDGGDGEDNDGDSGLVAGRGVRAVHLASTHTGTNARSSTLLLVVESETGPVASCPTDTVYRRVGIAFVDEKFDHPGRFDAWVDALNAAPQTEITIS